MCSWDGGGRSSRRSPSNFTPGSWGRAGGSLGGQRGWFCVGRTVGLGAVWGNGCEGSCGQRAPGDLGGLEGKLGQEVGEWRIQEMKRRDMSPMKKGQCWLQAELTKSLGKSTSISLRWSHTPQHRYPQLSQTHARHHAGAIRHPLHTFRNQKTVQTPA